MDTIDIAVLPGDGIGPEVTDQGIKVLQAAAELDGGLALRFTPFPWGCRFYLEHGRTMPADGTRILADFPLIYLGAVGFPGVPDHVSLWEMLLPIRQEFDQYVNLRPVKLLRGVTGPLRKYGAGEIDYVIVRENTEGEYAGVGGSIRAGTPNEVVVQSAVFTRAGTERVIRYAYDLAARRRGRLISATKSNGLKFSMPFWDGVFAAVGAEYPGVDARVMHCDALAAYLVLRPDQVDVVVGSNLFGDILSDLGAGTVGGIGLAPSANLNPEGRYPSLFEPVHGSAPDIAGHGIANPTGAIWTVALMLEHVGRAELGAAVLAAVEDVLTEGKAVTPDIGGRATTAQMGDAVAAALRRRA